MRLRPGVAGRQSTPTIDDGEPMMPLPTSFSPAMARRCLGILSLLIPLSPTDSRAEAIIAAGSGTTCALEAAGDVRCWGSNELGQADPPEGAFVQLSAGLFFNCGIRGDERAACWGRNDFDQAAPPGGVFSQISAGGGHVCGVRPQGDILCWGDDAAGQASPPQGTFSQVAAGDMHTCGLGVDGQVTCWGAGDDGQVDPPGGTFTQIATTFQHTCGLRTTGSVICWGNDDFGQSTPPGGTFVQVSTGYFHSCGLRPGSGDAGGEVVCWGNDDVGQGTPPSGLFTEVNAGDLHSCGLRPDGEVDCWGLEASGQAMPPGGPLARVSAGGVHSCGLDLDGAVACWGWNGFGQSDPPSGTFAQVSSGGVHTCGLDLDGNLACWGRNNVQQLDHPQGTFAQLSSGDLHNCALRLNGEPVCWGLDNAGQTNPPVGTFAQVSVGLLHSCGVRLNGQLACWGDDSAGQASPPPGTFVQVGSGDRHSCALGLDGEVVCWGDDRQGQASPPGVGDFIQLSVGPLHTCGILSNGEVACWGNDGDGQASPPLGAFAQVDVGTLHTCGIPLGGNGAGAVCWGYNGYGPTTVPTDFTTAPQNPGQSLTTTQLFNISTNGPVVDQGLQAGFIVTGNQRRFAVLGEAADGRLDARLRLTSLVDGRLIEENDTWERHPSAEALVRDLRAPAAATDAGFVVTLSPGAYVASLSSENGVMAPGIVAVTSLDDQNDTYPINISTQGGGAMVAGLIVTGNASRCYVVKAEGVGTPAMADPALVVRRLDGSIVDANDDWRSHPTAEIVEAVNFEPVRDAEAALATRLSEGVYLAELFSMRTSGADHRAIVAATELPESQAGRCDDPTPFEPEPVDDLATDTGVAPTFELQLIAPRARCVTEDGANHCTAYQGEKSVAIRQPVEFIAQARSSVAGETLSYSWSFDDTVFSEELAPNRVRVRFQGAGNVEATVAVRSPQAGTLTSRMRIRVLDPDGVGNR